MVHELPRDLRDALIANATALDAWNDITPLARNEFICWAEDAKREMTRERRIRRTQEELEEGQRRPCCSFRLTATRRPHRLVHHATRRHRRRTKSQRGPNTKDRPSRVHRPRHPQGATLARPVPDRPDQPSVTHDAADPVPEPANWSGRAKRDLPARAVATLQIRRTRALAIDERIVVQVTDLLDIDGCRAVIGRATARGSR